MSEDKLRPAVRWLNFLQLIRAENLRDGYDVSDVLCSNVD